MVPHTGLGVSVEHANDIYPAEAFHNTLAISLPPPLIRLRRFWPAPHRRPLGFELHIGADQQVVLPHQPQNPPELPQWDCHELARQLITQAIVEDSSACTVATHEPAS